jgi:hypothetical protein
MTGRAWMAVLGLIVIAFVLASCGQNNHENRSPQNTGLLSCSDYQTMVNGGYRWINFGDQTEWEVCSNANPNFCHVLTQDELRMQGLRNTCQGTYVYRDNHQQQWAYGHQQQGPLPRHRHR